MKLIAFCMYFYELSYNSCTATTSLIFCDCRATP